MQKGELLKRFMKSGRNSVLDNIVLCVFISVAASFYFYERHYSILGKIQVYLTAGLFVVWFLCALICGKNKKIGFLVFAYFYWLVPYIYSAIYDRISEERYYKALSFINDIMIALLKNPFRDVAYKYDFDPIALAAMLLMLTILAYVSGSLIAYFYEKTYGKADKIKQDAVAEEYDETGENGDKNIGSDMTLNDILKLNAKKSSSESEEDNYEEQR